MTKKNYQLTVVVINYKTPQLTIDCLTSLLSELSSIDAKVIVVDNASNDTSCELIQKWIDKQDYSEQIELIASVKNTGFSGGNNIGIQATEAEYYLLLNSDTLVRPGAIKILLDAAKADSSIGIISPRLEWLDTTPQESCFKFHTPISELISSAKTGIISKILYSFIVAQQVCSEKKEYDWTSFACVLVRAEVFDDIGLMDDGFFMYYEDVDFCYKVKKAGWKILNTPDAHFVHLRGGSSPVKQQTKLRKRLPRYFYESRTRYFYSIYGRLGLLAANLLWLLGYGISLVRSLLSQKYTPSASACQWRDIWINFLTPIKPYIHPENYDKT